MGWRIVEINTNEYMQLYLNNLMIKRNNEKILINISEIDTLIIHNTRSSVSINLLNALSTKNVNVITMDSKNEPSSFLIPVNGHHGSLKVLEKQINWTHQYKGIVWQKIIKNKIFNQLMNLFVNNIKFNRSYFVKLINNVTEFDVTNREGHAAKVYWNILFGKSFIRDQKSNIEPAINGMLNYGYAIIRSAMIKSIIKKGLDTRLSIFHKSFTNFFALASDLMEPFRPLVDMIVYKNRDAKIFTYDIKDKLIGVLDEKIKINGKKYYLTLAFDKIVDSLISGNGWLWVDLWE